MITSMMCSTMTRVMPERWISRTRSIASCTSRCVRPAMASSSNRAFGSVASARAISSRLRPGVPSERAGACASLPVPTRSSTACARRSASDLCEVRRNAPIITFSTTDMLSKVCGTWKVRANPSCARISGARRVTSRPSKKTLPDVDDRSPVRQLKKVDLPAPFGPIRPRMSPCCSVTEAALTALKLPKALVIACASRSMGNSPRRFGIHYLAGSFAPEPIDQRQDASGLKPGNKHDDRAIDHEGKTGALASQQIVGNLFERHQDCGTHKRSEQQAGAAERGHDQDLDRDQDAKSGFGIDKAEHHGVERAGDAGKRSA